MQGIRAQRFSLFECVRALGLRLEIAHLQVAHPDLLGLLGVVGEIADSFAVKFFHALETVLVAVGRVLLLGLELRLHLLRLGRAIGFQRGEGFAVAAIDRNPARAEIAGELLLFFGKHRAGLLELREEFQGAADPQVGGVIHSRFLPF